MSDLALETVRELPKCVEAEQMILGAVFLSPAEVLLEIGSKLSPADFYLARHRVLFRTMSELFLENLSPDVVTVAARLEDRGDLERAGGRVYLNELEGQAWTTTQVAQHVDIVRRKSVLRQLVDIGSRVTELGYDEATEPQALLDQAAALVLAPAMAMVESHIEHVGDFADEYLRRLDASVSGTLGMTCGYPSLDGVLFDVRGQLMVIAGLPHMGKTMMGLNMVYRQLQKGMACGVLSLEMTKYNLLERLVQMQGRLTRTRVRYEPGLRKSALRTLCALPIYVSEVRPKTLPSVLRQMRSMVQQHGVQSIMVDYIGLIEPPPAERNDIGIGMVVRALLEFAQAHDVLVIAPTQAGRDTMQSGHTMPNLWNMKDSAQIEAHADIILGITRPSYQSETEIPASEAFDVRILKQRAGLSGRKYRFTCFPGYQRIEERASEEVEEQEP